MAQRGLNVRGLQAETLANLEASARYAGRSREAEARAVLEERYGGGVPVRDARSDIDALNAEIEKLGRRLSRLERMAENGERY